MCAPKEKNWLKHGDYAVFHEIITKSVTVVRYKKKGRGWLCVGELTEEKT